MLVFSCYNQQKVSSESYLTKCMPDLNDFMSNSSLIFEPFDKQRNIIKFE